jgi:hypothetical protein
VSRAAAQAKLDDFIEEARSKNNSVRLVEKLYEIKTGAPIRKVNLDVLPDEWAKIPRRRKLDERYAGQCQATLRRFAAFVRQEDANAGELADVNWNVGRAFLQAAARNVQVSAPGRRHQSVSRYSNQGHGDDSSHAVLAG